MSAVVSLCSSRSSSRTFSFTGSVIVLPPFHFVDGLPFYGFPKSGAIPGTGHGNKRALAASLRCSPVLACFFRSALLPRDNFQPLAGNERKYPTRVAQSCPSDTRAFP